ncbi:hypothetical protein INR49_022349 [Caranx melampygus]|nr:hypothetical protein INR49_022349 [Caranx melampygus]
MDPELGNQNLVKAEAPLWSADGCLAQEANVSIGCKQTLRTVEEQLQVHHRTFCGFVRCIWSDIQPGEGANIRQEKRDAK